MLDSGYKNKHLGQNLKLHPVSGVAGKFSEEQSPGQAQCKEFIQMIICL